MNVEVLKPKTRIAAAREELHREDLSFTTAYAKWYAHSLAISKRVNIGDE